MSLREHGQFTRRNGNGRRNRRPHEANDDEEMQVLVYININPRSSVRHLARELHVSVRKIHSILKKNKYHSYRPNLV
jgi:hypothetical protein